MNAFIVVAVVFVIVITVTLNFGANFQIKLDKTPRD